MTGSITELRMALGEVTERLNSAYRCARDAEQGLAQAIAVLTELDRSSADRMVPQDLLRADPSIRWDRLLFSAKESVYKAWFQLTGRWLGFEEASLDIDPSAGTFSARILATSSRADDRTRVLKHCESFAVFDRGGSIRPVGLGETGLFHEGTRYLSAFELFIDNQRPLLLSSTVRQDNALIVDLANPDFADGPSGPLPRDTVHIFTNSFLWEAACYTRLRLHNYSLREIDLQLAIRFAADYADIFEIRGTRRERRGHRLDSTVGRGVAVLGYEGLDGRVRRTRLCFSPTPAELTESLAEIEALKVDADDQEIERTGRTLRRLQNEHYADAAKIARGGS